MKTLAHTPKNRTTKFAAGLVALSLAISGLSVAPARADDADVARAIGGLLTLFVIGKAVNNHTSKSTTSSAGTMHDRSNKHNAGRTAGRRATFEIPSSCVVSVGGKRDRLQTVAMERCVTRERRSAAALPRACETVVRTKSGRASAYDVGCLNNFGYRVTQSGGKGGSHGKGALR